MADAECDMDTGTGISPPLVGSGSESLDGNSDLLPVPDHEHALHQIEPDHQGLPPEPHQIEPDHQQLFNTHAIAFNERNEIHFMLPQQYDNVRRIASGTYGMVVAAKDNTRRNPRTGEPMPVAVKKILTPWHSAIHGRQAYRELRLLRYLQQSWPQSCAAAGIDVAGTIQHENIIALFNCFSAQSLNGHEDMYLVMEHGGGDLRTVSECQQLSLDQVKFIGYQITRGLLYLHSAGIIHRDLKPSNISCTTNCDIKILDFGLSRFAKRHGSLMSGYVATRYYRAPEVILEWGRYSEQMDMWSFGCVLGELLAQNGCKIMFMGEDKFNQVAQIAGVLGCPDESYIARMEPGAQVWTRASFIGSLRKILAQLPRFQGPHGEPPDVLAMDVLEKLMQYDPQVRLTAQKTLEHPFFEKYHDPTDEPKAMHPFDTSFERLQLDAAGWREMCLREIDDFRRNAPEMN